MCCHAEMPIVIGRHTGESSAKRRYLRDQRKTRGPASARHRPALPNEDTSESKSIPEAQRLHVNVLALRRQLLTGHLVRAHHGSLEDCQSALARAVAALRVSGHERIHDCVALCIPAPGERRVLLPRCEGVQYLLGGIAATNHLDPTSAEVLMPPRTFALARALAWKRPAAAMFRP